MNTVCSILAELKARKTSVKCGPNPWAEIWIFLMPADIYLLVHTVFVFDAMPKVDHLTFKLVIIFQLLK